VPRRAVSVARAPAGERRPRAVSIVRSVPHGRRAV
jgi:hypothetical protein